jgi:hypothetical protein
VLPQSEVTWLRSAENENLLNFEVSLKVGVEVISANIPKGKYRSSIVFG